MNKETRDLKKTFEMLVEAATICVDRIDQIMKMKESKRRGELIAEATNALDLANDYTMRFGFGFSFKKTKKVKEAVSKINAEWLAKKKAPKKSPER